MRRSRFLMCPPDHFGVEYVINPWMAGQIHAADLAHAIAQWQNLHRTLSSFAEVSIMAPQPRLPDLVFTANAALIWQRKAVLSNFRCLERRPEQEHYAEWLQQEGFSVVTLPEHVWFEGAGDALLDRGLQPLLWAGHGFRSHMDCVAYLERELQIEIQPLQLIDPRFYHLDTCFCPLERGHLLYFAPAFDGASNAAIERRVPLQKRLALEEHDAIRFTCNAVNTEGNVISNHFSEPVAAWLADRGFQTLTCRTSEFMKAGGSTKCLSLRLNEGESLT